MRRHLLDTMVQMAFYRGKVPAKWARPWRDVREGRRSLVAVESRVAELFSRIARTDGEEAARDRILWVKGLRRTEVVPADDNIAMAAGRLYARHNGEHGVSLADCFALAVARERRAEVLTADRGMRDCARAEGVSVSWLPKGEVS